ncbi:MAG: hypothetical protein ACJARS_001887 [bacterium]|jgi:hypothetical protein
MLKDDDSCAVGRLSHPLYRWRPRNNPTVQNALNRTDIVAKLCEQLAQRVVRDCRQWAWEYACPP